MEENREKIYGMIGFARAGQLVLGLILTGVVSYDYFQGGPIFGASLIGREIFGPVSAVLWGLCVLLALLFLALLHSMKQVDGDKKMTLLRFWVRQLHRSGRSSAPALVLVLSSLGEAVLILSFLIYLFGGKAPEYFLPGMLAGLVLMLFSRPTEKIKDSLALLDQLSEM